MKKLLFLFLISLFLSNVYGQTAPTVKMSGLDDYGVKIEPDKRIIVVMAALIAAGVETPLNERNKEFRKKLLNEIKVDPAVLEKMKVFLGNYRQRHVVKAPQEFTAPFVSLACSLSPVPELREPVRSTDLPENLLDVLDFAPLVREFYQSSDIKTKLPEYVQIYQDEGNKMNSSAREMINAVASYLHATPQLVIYEKVRTPDPKNKKQEIVTNVEHDRHFYIVPDLLAASGTVNFRNIGYDYYVIVPSNTNLRVSEARRAYLQFVLDPFVLKNTREIVALNDGIKKLVEERRKVGAEVSYDPVLTVLRSLVAAVDTREREQLRVQAATDDARRKIDFAKTDDEKKGIAAALNSQKQEFSDETAIDLSEAYERGAVLAFYFAAQLKGLEDSGFDIASSLHDMILSIDTSKESNRLAEFSEARKRGLVARQDRINKAPQEEILNQAAIDRAKGLNAKLGEIEVQTKAKNFDESESRLTKLLDEYPGEPSIYYALGRVASLSAEGTFDEGLRDKRLENAKLHYSNAIRSATADTDPALIQLSYVALGRIFAFYQDGNSALQLYQTALKYGGANAAAYREAQTAINRLTAPKQP